MSAYATNHSLERAKERRNLKQHAAKRDIKRAFENGKRAEDFSSWERQYLLKAQKGCVAVAYNGYCYLFDEDDARCITLYRLPPWFGQNKRATNKERVREYKRNKLSLAEQDLSLEELLYEAEMRSAEAGQSSAPGGREAEREMG